MDVPQDILAESCQFGSNRAGHFVAFQVDADMALAGHIETGGKEIKQRLQFERLEVEVAEIVGMVVFLAVEPGLAEKRRQVLFLDQVYGPADEVRDEEIAVVRGAGYGRFKGHIVQLVFQLRGECHIADIEDLVFQHGLQGPEVGMAQEGALGRLCDIGVESELQGRILTLVEMQGIQISIVQVHVDHVMVVLPFAAQFDVAMEDELEIRVAAHHVGLQHSVLHHGRSDDVVVIVAVESEMIDQKRFHGGGQSFLRSGKTNVGLASQGAKGFVAEQAAQLERLGSKVSFCVEAA